MPSTRNLPKGLALPTPQWPPDGLTAMAMKRKGRDPATLALRRLVKKLNKANIPHAILGGMAVYAHGYERLTADVDVLVTPEGLAAFKERFIPKDYEQVEGRPRRFVDRVNGITVDLLVTGRFPGLGKPGPIAFPDPLQVRQQIGSIYYVDLVNLIQLKLAARRWRDFADVVELIRFNHLDESYSKQLHPSVRQDFIECLEEKQREDEYEARNS